MESINFLREYYQKTTIGWVCTVTEDEFIDSAKEVSEEGCILRLKATNKPTSIDSSKSYIRSALNLDDKVLEPVAFRN